MEYKSIIAWGAVFGALGVMTGAFGAHALKSILVQTSRVETYETAVKYMFYHSLVLLCLGMIAKSVDSEWWTWSAWMFVFGIIIFSGSLFLLILLRQNWLGAITPLGGLLLIGGWIAMVIGLFKTQ